MGRATTDADIVSTKKDAARAAFRRKLYAEARAVRGRNKHHAVVARCQRIVRLASADFKRRCAGLDEEMNRIRRGAEFSRIVTAASDLGESKRALHLPALYVDKDSLRAVFGHELLQQGQPLGIGAMSTRFVWSIGRHLRLHRHRSHKYFPWFSRRLVNVETLRELPSLRSSPKSFANVYPGPSAKMDRFRDKLEQKAELAICTVKLLDVVEQGSLIDLLAERLQSGAQ
jgi:hypothetical protein